MNGQDSYSTLEGGYSGNIINPTINYATFGGNEMKESKLKMKWVDKDMYARGDGILIVSRSVRDLLDGKMIVGEYSQSISYSSVFFGEHGVEDGDIALSISHDDVSFKKYFRDQSIEFNTFLVGEKMGGYLRTVYPAIVPENCPLKFGLTVHSSKGSWSSYPPHEFEANSLFSPAEFAFEEKFAYVTDPPNGWGLQVVGRRPVMPIVDRQIVDIPLSSHPVVAAPDVTLMYFWAYYGERMNKFTDHGRV